MSVPVFCVVGPQRIELRIVPAREAAIFHISCYSHDGVDRSVHGQVRREHPALDVLADSVTFRKEAGSQKLTQNDGVAARLPIFFSKAGPLEDWDLKDAKVGGGHGTQNHRSARMSWRQPFPPGGSESLIPTAVTPGKRSKAFSARK